MDSISQRNGIGVFFSGYIKCLISYWDGDDKVIQSGKNSSSVVWGEVAIDFFFSYERSGMNNITEESKLSHLGIKTKYTIRNVIALFG